MSRETVIAIGFGVGLGVLVGVGVLFQTNKAEETKVIPITRENDQKKVVSEEDQVGKQSNNLVITSPNDHTIIAKNTIEVVGKVKANSLIAIQSAAAEIIEKNEHKEPLKEELKHHDKIEVEKVDASNDEMRKAADLLRQLTDKKIRGEI